MVKSKYKTHRFRSDCTKHMASEILKAIGQERAVLVYSHEEMDWSGKHPKKVADQMEYLINGIRVTLTVKFPDNCSICGCDEHRLDQKHGRTW